MNSVNVLTGLARRATDGHTAWMAKHVKSHKWAEDNTEPSLRRNLEEGVTTTKGLNWPNPPLALRWKEGQALAASSRLWLNHISAKAAPRRHLQVGGVRYSLTSLETTRGSLKDDPAKLGRDDLRLVSRAMPESNRSAGADACQRGQRLVDAGPSGCADRQRPVLQRSCIERRRDLDGCVKVDAR